MILSKTPPLVIWLSVQKMEEQCSPLSWGYCFQEEGNEELKYSFLYTLELESTIESAKEEIAKREFEFICLKDVLNRTIKERDEAQAKCQKLMLEHLLLQQHLQKQQQPHQQEAASTEDESKPSDPKKHFSTSPSADCNKDNIVATSFTSPKPQQPIPQQQATLRQAVLSTLADEKPLPEKGRLLKSVMEAGPLLQTLLLAGPLPQWQHPPPQLDSIEIPPVSISSSSPRLSNQPSFNSINKGDLELKEDSDSSPNSKYQKLAAFH